MLTNSKTRNSLFTVIGILAIGVLIWVNVPPSYSINVSNIGKGKFALVQVFDESMKYSTTLKDQVNNIRDEFEKEVDFYIVEDTNSMGRAFMEKYQAPRFTLMLFSPEGKILYRSTGVDSEIALKKILKDGLKR